MSDKATAPVAESAREAFTYRVTDGWLRDLASQATPGDAWPCIRWDDRLLEDQKRFLAVQAAMGVDCNLAWGLFVDRNWPAPFEKVIGPARAARLAAFVNEAHSRGVKVLSGVGIYSWGFDEIVRNFPEVSCGAPNRRGYVVMCADSRAAWDWQKRVLDFLMDPRWGLDGISMQSADNGRCECEKCARLTPAAYHAEILVRCAEYVREQRPEWIIGQACWGLPLDDPAQWEHLARISGAVDYMVEVAELTARAGVRKELAGHLECAFGSVGGVFVEPPQHWARTRWFLPTALGSASALKALWADGGRACEYFYRIFANPADEVSWRAGAAILSAPETAPHDALREAAAAVYGVTGAAADELAGWYERAEAAYFSRADFRIGDGPLSLEPLIWNENPAAPGPPVYLTGRMTAAARADYAADLRALRSELSKMPLPREDVKARTLQCLDGALAEAASLE